jgi:hypothetical protein
VEAPVSRAALRRAAIAAAALGALAFLAAMAITGRTRESRQHVKFEPAGLMRETPAEIDRIELLIPPRRLAFQRAGGRWTMLPPRDGQGPASSEAPGAPPDVSAHVEMSLRFMHATAPVRVMAGTEYAGEPLGNFGLDPPSYAVSLHRGADTVLRVRFGAPTPQTVLQYVQVEGSDALYLLPIFVGQEWERVARGVPS